MFGTQVYKWNSVNICNSENSLYVRGIVVDKTETGLLVDLGIANKKPELVAFDRMIQDDEPNYPPIIDSGHTDLVNPEVLLQLSANKPWTWYPAEILPGSKDSFVLVRAKITDWHSVFDIVRHAQIRCCTKSETSVRLNDYLKEYVNIPYDDFVVTSAFRDLWIRTDRLRRTYPIRVVDRKLYYLRWFCDMDLDPSTVAAVIEESRRQNTPNNRGIKRTHKESHNEKPALHHRMDAHLLFSDLPYEILHLVLTHLDIVQLVRYRRVCPLWNSVITSMDSTKVVIYDISTYDDKDSFGFAAVLFKLIKTSTMYLIFTGRRENLRTTSNVNCFAQAMDVTKRILDHTGIVIPTLVVADFEMDRSDLLDSYRSTAVSASLQSTCQRMVLVRVTLFNLFQDDSALSPYRDLEVFYASIKMDKINQWELRDALDPSAEQFMKSVSQHDMRRLNHWIRKVSDAGNEKQNLLHKILQVLTMWDGDHHERRFAAACVWNDMAPTPLNINLDTLHCVTVMCLLNRMEEFSRPGEFEDIDQEE